MLGSLHHYAILDDNLLCPTHMYLEVARSIGHQWLEQNGQYPPIKGQEGKNTLPVTNIK
jgi:hypothetical protein